MQFQPPPIVNALLTDSMRAHKMLRRKEFWLIELFVSVLFQAHGQALVPVEQNHMIVTVPQKPEAFHKNRALKWHRPQLYSDSSGVELRINNANKLPRVVRKVRVRYKGADRASYRVTKRDIRAQIEADRAKLFGSNSSPVIAITSSVLLSNNLP